MRLVDGLSFNVQFRREIEVRGGCVDVRAGRFEKCSEQISVAGTARVVVAGPVRWERPALMSLSESEIQHAILKEFGAHPSFRLWRSNSGAMRSPSGRMVSFNFPGMADISGFIMGGQAFYIEVKSATGRQSQAQKNFEAICLRFGVVYILARSVQDVRTGLAQRGIYT